jgi:hypothetical protein
MEQGSNPRLGAWLLFLAGIGSVPVWTFAVRDGQLAAWGLSFLACVSAPLLSDAPPGKKVALALLALLAFAVSLVSSLTLLFAVRGIPVG